MEYDVYGAISILERGLKERITDFLREYGIDSEVYRCLEYIRRNGGCTASFVARELEQDRAVINRRLARLGERGFICKKTGRRDSRSNLLYVTPAGKTISEGVGQIIQDWNTEVSHKLNNEVLRSFVQSVQDMSEMVL